MHIIRVYCALYAYKYFNALSIFLLSLYSTCHYWLQLLVLRSNIMELKNKFLRMSDLANQSERPARTYTTESGQQRTITARPATSGITGFSAKHIYHLIKIKQFPAPIKIGCASLWRVSDINDWLDSHISSSNNEEA